MDPLDWFIKSRLKGLTFTSTCMLTLLYKISKDDTKKVRLLQWIDAGKRVELGSHVTLHGAVNTLIEKKFVDVIPSPDDKRVKFCEVNKKGLAFLQ